MLAAAGRIYKRRRTLQHLQGSLGEPDENTIVDLQQAQELQCLALFGIDLVDTLYPNNEGQPRLSGDVEAVALLCFTREPYPLPVGVAVLFHILFRPCEDNLALFLALVCLMLAQCLGKPCAIRIERVDCIIPERWLTIRQH
jgi:hypothetical protein